MNELVLVCEAVVTLRYFVTIYTLYIITKPMPNYIRCYPDTLTLQIIVMYIYIHVYDIILHDVHFD